MGDECAFVLGLYSNRRVEHTSRSALMATRLFGPLWLANRRRIQRFIHEADESRQPEDKEL